MGFFDTQFALQTSDVVGFTPEQRTAVEMGVYVSIYDEATWLYKNLKHPRYSNFYGYAQIMSGTFVVKDVALNFLNQEILHWRDETFGINETTGCYAKGIASALQPPFTLVTNTVKTRQRYTSVRFRLLPGVGANVSLIWETAQAKCGGNILEPDAKQGQPALPNNGGASPNPRPSNQGGDPLDGSNNDGGFNPNDGNPAPPGAGGGVGTGVWKVLVSGQDFNGRAFTATYVSNVTDRFATVTATTEPTGVGANSAGAIDRKLVLIVNGVSQNTTATGFGLSAFNPYYA